MKKKLWIIAVAVVLVLLLIPMPIHLDDGGTVIYQAVLYEVKDVKKLNSEYVEFGGTSEDLYIEGTIVKILGMEVYNDTKK